MKNNNLTKRQMGIIADNYSAFTSNFGEPIIIYDDVSRGYYVYKNIDEYKNRSYIQYCYNIHHLDGWLIGCVQGFHKRLV